jgi:Mg2+ and Co2+ transporter CorA
MTIFSVLAIIFMPPTLITGLFGMNVNVPFQTYGEDVDLNEKSLWYVMTVHNGPFFTIALLSILMSISLLFGFQKMNLL